MVARVSFIAARSKENVGDHVMHPTEPEDERDERLAYERLPHPGENNGTLPLLRADLHPRAAKAFGVPGDGRVPTRKEVHNFVGGYRLDGKPLARSKHAAGAKMTPKENAALPPSQRRAGSGRWTTKAGAPKKDDPAGRRRVDTISIVLYPHISWSIAETNALTPAGRAAVHSVFRAAVDDTMAAFEDRVGYTRRGQGGRLGLEGGSMVWMMFVQQAPRPDEQGQVSPGMHAHVMAAPVVVTKSGHIGAIATNLAKQFDSTAFLHERLAVRGREAGMRIAMVKGAAVLLDVPGNVCDHFSRRTRDAWKDAGAYVRRKLGRDPAEYRAEKPEHWAGLVGIGAQKTRAKGPARDGMLDRAAVREECRQLGFSPVDVVRPRSAVPSAGHVLGPAVSLMQQSAELASAAARTGLMHQVAREQAAARGLPPPNLRAAVAAAREEDAVERAIGALCLWLDSTKLVRASRQTLEFAKSLAPGAIAARFARHREEKTLERAAAVVLSERRPLEEIRRLRFESEVARRDAVVTARLAAEKSAAGAISATMARVREGKALEVAAAAVLRPSAAPSPPAPPKREPISQAEAEVQLREALRNAGIDTTGHSIAWGKRTLTYLPARGPEGGKFERGKGGYRAYFDGARPAAAIYNWKDTAARNGHVGNWKADAELAPRTEADKAAAAQRIAAQKAADEAATAERHRKGSEKARKDYAAAGECPKDHPYFAAKGLAPPPGVRMDAKGNAVVPMKLASGAHVNNETISPDGKSKLPTWGAPVEGAAFPIGAAKAGHPVVLLEGVATAASVHRSTGEFSVACRNAGNLLHVAKAIRAAHPSLHIVIGADNDSHLPARPGDKARQNVGVEKAMAAAKAVGNASVWVPPIIPERHAADKGTDWDDVRQRHGDSTVAAAWEAHRRGRVSVAPKAPPDRQNPWAALQAAGAALSAASPPQRVEARLRQ